MSEPNLGLQLVHAGYSHLNALGTTQVDPSDEALAYWYRPDVDLIVATELYTKINVASRSRINYTAINVRAYIAMVCRLWAQYVSAKAWWALTQKRHGTLTEVNRGVELLYPHHFNKADEQVEYNTTYANTMAYFELVESALAGIALPPDLVNEITWLFTPKRATQFEDAPIIGMAPSMADFNHDIASWWEAAIQGILAPFNGTGAATNTNPFGWYSLFTPWKVTLTLAAFNAALAALRGIVGSTGVPADLTSGTSLTEGFNTDHDYPTPITQVWENLKWFKNQPNALRISANLLAMEPGWQLPTYEPDSVPFDAEWMEVWAHTGQVQLDHAHNVALSIATLNVLGGGNHGVVPNAARSDEASIYQLAYDLGGVPSDRVVANLAFGMGDEERNVRGMHITNYGRNFANPGSDRGMDATHRLPFCYVTLDDPASDPVGHLTNGITLRVRRLNALDKGDKGGFTIGSIQDTVRVSSELSKFNLGWQAALQQVGNDEDDRGYARCFPKAGRRFYADALSMQADVLRYRLSQFGM